MSSRPRALGAGIAHGDRLGEERAVHVDVAHAAGLEIGAHELPGLAIEDFDDFAARAFTAAGPRRGAVATNTTSPLAASPVDFRGM